MSKINEVQGENCSQIDDFTSPGEDNETNSFKVSSESLNAEELDEKIVMIRKKSNEGIGSKEEEKPLNELGVSTKGEVNKSLLLKYFRFADRPYALIFLIVAFPLNQTILSLADVWVGYW